MEGSFHDITAHKYFEGEQLQIYCCDTFEEVFAQMKNDPTVIGLTAIENTIAGSLLHTTNCCATAVRRLSASTRHTSRTVSAPFPPRGWRTYMRCTLTLWR